MKFPVVSALFFLISIGYIAALVCYRCSDDVVGEQPCDDPENFYSDDCSYLGDDSKEKICYILNAQTETGVIQDRGCFYKEPEDGLDFCTYMGENTPEPYISCDVCSEDLCNL